MRPAGSSTLNVADDGVADVSPLNVRKRSLPNVPLVARLQPPVLGGGALRIPSAPGPRRDSTVLDDNFDYISAYLDGDSTASPPKNGYGSGNFATNLDSDRR